jgi:heptose-I-phosphate ethanolaminephosphotransferase
MGEKLLENISKTNIDSCSFKSPNIVLIIGESYNKYHSSLYGYNKNTTPYQQILKEKGCLYLFNDVISSYNLTFKSFQNVLSLYSIDKPGVWYNYPMLMPLFRKAGYEVNFFSNQYCIDKSEAFSDFIEDMFINNKQLDKHFFDNRNPVTHNYDDELLNDYITLCDTTGSKPQLNIFHFIGIHAEFNKRFPEEWNKFKTTDYNRDDLDNSQKQILADYDNAIAYNDYVINNIISFFENKNSIIIYVPDHGELIFDNGPEFGRNLTIKKEIIKPQYDIPFWIYCTPEYKAKHESLCNEIACSLNKPFMTDDLPHLILYLAGINADCYDEERNIISSRFNVNRKRLIQENIDYDKLVLNPTNTKIL